jgi:hypothetical protein
MSVQSWQQEAERHKRSPLNVRADSNSTVKSLLSDARSSAVSH